MDKQTLTTVLGNLKVDFVKDDDLEDSAKASVPLGPVKSLPAELLSEVFLFTIPRLGHVRARDEIGLPLPQPKDAPWLLLQVCHRWRLEALANCRLWSALYIRLRGTGHQLDLLDACLTRSHPLPMVLRVASDGASSVHESAQSRCINILREHAWRWQHLDMEFSHVPRELVMLQPLPSLETIRISVHGSASTEIDGISFIELRDAHRLREASIRSTTHDIAVTLIWENLTRLEITSSDIRLFSVDGALALMSQAQNLEECYIGVITTFAGPSSTSSVNMRRLRVLHITVSQVFDGLLRNLRTPVLLSLQILNDPNDILSQCEVPTSEFKDFLQRSATTLTNLTLVDVRISDVSLIPCLELLQNLQRLNVSGEPSMGWMVSALLVTRLISDTNPQSTILPSLEDLRLSWRDDSHHLLNNLIVLLIRSRWEMEKIGISRLSTGVLYIQGLNEEESMRRQLEDLVEEGLFINFARGSSDLSFSP
jgi:hypothetical protein